MARTGANTVGTIETGVKGVVEIGVASAAERVAVGITMSAATFGSSKVSTIRRTDIQNEWRLHQNVIQIYINGRRKKAMIKGEGKT